MTPRWRGCYWWSGPQRSLRKPAPFCVRYKSPRDSSDCFSFTVYILFYFFGALSEIMKSSPETCKRLHHLEGLLQKSFVVVHALIKITAAAVMCDRNIYCGKCGSRWKPAWRQLRVTDRNARFLCLCITEANALHQRKSTHAVWQKRLFVGALASIKMSLSAAFYSRGSWYHFTIKLYLWQRFIKTFTAEIIYDLRSAFQDYNDIFVPSFFMEYDVISGSQWCLYNPTEELLPENKT